MNAKKVLSQNWDTRKVVNMLINNALLIIMVMIVIYVSITRPNFVKPASLINLLSQTFAYLPPALGIAGAIVLTGTDLSAGRIVGLTACISASLLQAVDAPVKMWKLDPLPIPLVIIVAVVIGALIGAFNGFWVAKFKLHPFIVTLATQLILFTLLLLYVQMGDNHGQAIASLADNYKFFITGSILSIPLGNGVSAVIPNYIWYAILLTILMWFIWNKTTFGKNMFALGANEEAARVSGVNVFMTTVLVFALAGAMYGFTGFVEAARIGSNTPNTGVNYELDAIAACVIGGVSFVGGIGRIRGVILGVLLLRLIFVALPILGMDQNLQYAIKGGIILVACALDMRKYLVKR